MPGFQIGSHVGDWNLDAKELYPIYKTAEELGKTSVSGGLKLRDSKFYVKSKMTRFILIKNLVIFFKKKIYFDFT